MWSNIINWIIAVGTISAGIVAIIAICISVQNNKEFSQFNRDTFNLTKEHNRLSVEPKLSHLHGFNSWDDPDRIETITLFNAGLGPAIIKSIKYRYEGSDYVDLNEIYMKNIAPNTNFMGKASGKFELDDQYVLGSNTEIKIFELIYANTEDNNKSLKRPSDIRLIINYETIYSETREFCEKLSNSDLHLIDYSLDINQNAKSYLDRNTLQINSEEV